MKWYEAALALFVGLTASKQFEVALVVAWHRWKRPRCEMCNAPSCGVWMSMKGDDQNPRAIKVCSQCMQECIEGTVKDAMGRGGEQFPNIYDGDDE